MRTPVGDMIDYFTPLNDIMAKAEEEYQQERAAGIIEQVQQQEVQVEEEVIYEFEYDPLQNWFDNALKPELSYLAAEKLAVAQIDIIEMAKFYRDD